MERKNNILLVQVPESDPNRLQELRDCILQSLPKSVLVLPDDASYAVLELPPLYGVEMAPDREVTGKDEPEECAPADTKKVSPQDRAEVKRAIVRQRRVLDGEDT